MSLKNIGNILELIKGLKQYDNIDDAVLGAFDSVDELVDILEKFPNLKKYTKKLDFADDLLKYGGIADDISDIGEAATKSQSKVSGLGAAFRGLGAVIKNHPYISGAVAVASVATIGHAIYKNYKENLIKAADEGASAWKTSKK